MAADINLDINSLLGMLQEALPGLMLVVFPVLQVGVTAVGMFFTLFLLLLIPFALLGLFL